jgi:hypothetical protein
MPPFKLTSVGDGAALMLSIGVIRQVVTSSSTLNSLPLGLGNGHRSRFPLQWLIRPRPARAASATDMGMALATLPPNAYAAVRR